jgi:hypothetical protein
VFLFFLKFKNSNKKILSIFVAPPPPPPANPSLVFVDYFLGLWVYENMFGGGIVALSYL